MRSASSGEVPRSISWVIIVLGTAFALFFLGFEVGPVFLVLSILAAISIVIGRPLLENFGADVVFNGSIVNVTERSGYRSENTGGVEYGTDLDRARAVILDAVGRIDAVFNDPRRAFDCEGIVIALPQQVTWTRNSTDGKAGDEPAAG